MTKQSDEKPVAYVLPADFREALMRYFNERPYGEAVGAMTALAQLKPVEHRVPNGNEFAIK